VSLFRSGAGHGNLRLDPPIQKFALDSALEGDGFELVNRRLRHRLMRRTGDYGRGFERFTQDYLHDTLGLYRIPSRRADLPRAKV
jgi:hypothetical protein